MENLTDKLKPIDKDSEAIILLHGLARTSRSMNKAAKLLAAYGYQIVNVDYPSRSADISLLAQKYLAQALKQCDVKGVKKIHFLTHSMGGILLRGYLASRSIDKLGRVVMLAPPNQGSEVVDKLGGWRLFYTLNGPAGLQLGTGKDSMPNQLGPVNFQLGIIAGSKSINPLLSRLIPGINDGKVSVSRAQVAGMQDFIVMPYSHPFIMRRVAVIEQALHFIQQGYFAR
ncbi:MAG: alpha/beta fold hydrolase [Methylobacter sp.]|uniref:Alpha/beta fold hydrolase n=1 Tax=Candidatus Methylobacter titanis TaxID=3053457 RepID=A0AA43Q312_9GAMM|nr:alpha/beta fold hydrolase [Candidatus Methylobacter titanis]